MTYKRIEVRNYPFTRVTYWPDTSRAGLFTTAATDVLEDAAHLAVALCLFEAVPPVVVLLGVLRRAGENGRLGLAVLEGCGVDRQLLELDIRQALDPQVGTRGNVLDLGKVCEVASRAEEEAAGLGHNWVGSEHLVLALFGMGDPTVNDLFHKHGVTREAFQAKLAEFLGPYRGAKPGFDSPPRHALADATEVLDGHPRFRGRDPAEQAVGHHQEGHRPEPHQQQASPPHGRFTKVNLLTANTSFDGIGS